MAPDEKGEIPWLERYTAEHPPADGDLGLPQPGLPFHEGPAVRISPEHLASWLERNGQNRDEAVPLLERAGGRETNLCQSVYGKTGDSPERFTCWKLPAGPGGRPGRE